MSEFEIVREDKGTSGRYVVYLEGGLEAEMTYQRAGNVLAIDHTFVPPEFRGTDIARRLVQQGVDDARADGNLIRPVCSYVVAQFRRHPEWADLHA